MAVSAKAQIGEGSVIAPEALIQDDVIIGKNCKIHPNAQILNGTRIKDNTEICAFSVIGGDPQVKGWEEVPTYAEIGSNCVIREYVTINRSMNEGKSTIVGDDCYLMASSHVGHDAILAEGVIIVNYTGIPGHVEVGRKAFLSGYVGPHQFGRIGELSMIGGMTRLPQDVPPYFIAEGNPVKIRGVNSIGLKRDGKSREVIKEIKEAYKTIYLRKLPLKEALLELETNFESEEVKNIVQFCKTSKRGIIR